MTKAPAPINGGMICPPDDATASTAAAIRFGYPSDTIVGKVTMPVEATLADADPEIDPNKADDKTETFAAPPLNRPAADAATFIKPAPASPAFSIAPKITNMATIETETPVRVPQMPPSAIVIVPRKLASGVPGCPNSPGT